MYLRKKSRPRWIRTTNLPIPRHDLGIGALTSSELMDLSTQQNSTFGILHRTCHTHNFYSNNLVTSVLHHIRFYVSITSNHQTSFQVYSNLRACLLKFSIMSKSSFFFFFFLFILNQLSRTQIPIKQIHLGGDEITIVTKSVQWQNWQYTKN